MADPVDPTKLRQRLLDLERPIAWLARHLGVSTVTAGRWVNGGELVPRSRQAQILLFLELPPAQRGDFFDPEGRARSAATTTTGGSR